MQLYDIDATTVRDALRAIRAGRSLSDSPLLALDAITVRLREDGATNSPQQREWALAQLLSDIAWANLNRLRGAERALGRQAIAVDSERSVLRADFAERNIELEAWSVLHYRYFGLSRLEMREVAEQVGVSPKTLSRRLARGHRLLAEAVREEEQAADAPRSRRPHLPRPLTTFIGREREIADVRALLAQHRLVTLIGLGGIGKSRLAIHLAHDLAGSYADGVWFVEMASLGDGRQVPQAVMSAIGLREQPGRLLTDLLINHLSEKHVLLVLDNCEHVVEAASALARLLLHRCPSLQILATSREELHVAGQAPFSVPPMSLPAEVDAASASTTLHYDAVRLFGDRAAMAKPTFRLGQDNALQVTRICKEVDGIPLAIELAAARARFLSLDQLEARLTDRFKLLRDGRHAARPEHATLRAALDLSYELLAMQEQVLLRRLSVFRGSWTLEAAEAVCSGDGIAEADILDLLTDLVAKSVVVLRHDGSTPRYDMLETVRAYARQRLDEEGASEEVRRRHRSYFMEYVATARPHLAEADAVRWFDRLEAELHNIRSAITTAVSEAPSDALRLAVDMQLVWARRGYLSEGRELIIAALDAVPEDTSGVPREAAMNNIGVLSYRLGDHGMAETYLARSVSTLKQRGNLQRAAEILVNLGHVLFSRGEYSRAAAEYERAIRWSREVDDDANIAKALMQLGNIAYDEGDFELASEHLQDSLALHQALEDEYGVATSQFNLARVRLAQGEYQAAEEMIQGTLATWRSFGHKRKLARAISQLADIAYRQEALEEARALEEESLAIRRETGDEPGIAESLRGLGGILLRLGEQEAAYDRLSEGLALYYRMDEQLNMAGTLDMLADHAACERQYRRAIRLLGSADTTRGPSGTRRVPADQERAAAITDDARAALGEEAVERARSEGCALTLDEAIAYALGDVTWAELASEVAERLKSGAR